MNVALQNLPGLFTKAELALIRASQSPELANWTAIELKRHAVLARKLTDKWQGLARSQARVESRKSGSPNLESRSHVKHEQFQSALQAFEARLAEAERTAPGSSGFVKATAEVRNKQAREVRQSTRKDLHRTKQAINKTVTKTAVKKAPAVKKVKSSEATKPSPKPKTKAAKTTKSKAPKRKVKRVTSPVAAVAVPTVTKKPATKKTAVKSISPVSGGSQRAIGGKVKATRVAISGRSSRIAAHVSAKGKRAQARRDAKR